MRPRKINLLFALSLLAFEKSFLSPPSANFPAQNSIFSRAICVLPQQCCLLFLAAALVVLAKVEEPVQKRASIESAHLHLLSGAQVLDYWAIC
jgi:hypothetical protein